MVKIRLRRTGAKKKPTYRVVVADSRTPRDGRFIEIIGHYNPRTEPSTVKLEEDRVLHWLTVGAQPTDTVRKMLTISGSLDRFARLKKGADLEELLAEASSVKGSTITEPIVEDDSDVEEEETSAAVAEEEISAAVADNA